MANGGAAPKAAWVFVCIALWQRAVAVRTSDYDDSSLGEEEEEESRHGDSSIEAGGLPAELTQYFSQGRASEARATCGQIQERMANVTAKATRELQSACTADVCDFTMLGLNDMIMAQGMVTAVAAVADRKKCLPSVMGSPAEQQKLGELLSLVPRVLRSAQSVEGRARLQEAWLQLVSFQKGVLGLGAGLADRQLLLGFDIEKECPGPCQKCDRHDSSGFGFRCLLRRADKDRTPELAEHHGVTCETPKRRWFRWYPFSRQCKVADWKETALQYMQVSAVLGCASTTMVMGLNSELSQTQRRDMHSICMKTEIGQSLSTAEEMAYKAQLEAIDEVVSKHLKLAFNVILTHGIASGLAGLRQATRGNERAPVLLEGGGKGSTVVEPEDFFAAYESALDGEDLVLRDEDVAMYIEQHAGGRTETSRRLDVCEDVYDVLGQNSFSEGAKPLFTMSAMIVQHERDAEKVQATASHRWRATGDGPLPDAQVYFTSANTGGVSAHRRSEGGALHSTWSDKYLWLRTQPMPGVFSFESVANPSLFLSATGGENSFTVTLQKADGQSELFRAVAPLTGESGFVSLESLALPGHLLIHCFGIIYVHTQRNSCEPDVAGYNAVSSWHMTEALLQPGPAPTPAPPQWTFGEAAISIVLGTLLAGIYMYFLTYVFFNILEPLFFAVISPQFEQLFWAVVFAYPVAAFFGVAGIYKWIWDVVNGLAGRRAADGFDTCVKEVNSTQASAIELGATQRLA